MKPLSAVFGLLVLFAGTSVGDEVSATGASTDTFHFSGSFFNSCTNEDVAFELDCRFVANSNPGSEQFHQQCHGTAVGVTTGNEYQINEVFRFRDSSKFFACHGTEEIHDEWYLVSKGALPNQSVGFRERCTYMVENDDLCRATCLLLDFGMPKCSGKK